MECMPENLRAYERECALLARLANSVKLHDQPIQLLRMMESSSEPRSRRNFPYL
jgi:hypothetical protein